MKKQKPQKKKKKKQTQIRQKKENKMIVKTKQKKKRQKNKNSQKKRINQNLGKNFLTAKPAQWHQMMQETQSQLPLTMTEQCLIPPPPTMKTRQAATAMKLPAGLETWSHINCGQVAIAHLHNFDGVCAKKTRQFLVYFLW